MNIAEASRHWYDHGIDEGRQSNAEFSISAYRDRYHDLGGHSFREALAHWFLNGKQEERDATP
jgi:hypothetical protein